MVRIAQLVDQRTENSCITSLIGVQDFNCTKDWGANDSIILLLIQCCISHAG